MGCHQGDPWVTRVITENVSPNQGHPGTQSLTRDPVTSPLQVLETRVHERVRCMVFGSRGGQVVGEPKALSVTRFRYPWIIMDPWINQSFLVTHGYEDSMDPVGCFREPVVFPTLILL